MKACRYAPLLPYPLIPHPQACHPPLTTLLSVRQSDVPSWNAMHLKITFSKHSR